MRAMILAMLLLSFFSVGNAEARHRHHHYRHVAHHHHRARGVVESLGRGIAHMLESAGHNVAAARARGLPWCGAYMADLMHVTGALARELWVAANWARLYGHATTAHVGAVVVWRHHVGKIVGQSGGQWIVLSGNDGHAVRARARSLRGAIAFREG